MEARDERFERGRTVIITLSVALGAAGVALAASEIPVERDFSVVARGEGLGAGRVVIFDAVARPDLGRERYVERGSGGDLVPITGRDFSPGDPVRVFGYFSAKSEHELRVGSSSAAEKLRMVARRAMDLDGVVKEKFAGKLKVEEPLVVLEIGARGEMIAPLAPLMFAALGVLVLIKGWPLCEQLKGKRKILMTGSEYYHVVQLGLLASAMALAAAVEELAVLAGYDAPWVMYAAALALAPVAFWAARHVTLWVGIGMRTS